jgi:hypothetical protein
MRFNLTYRHLLQPVGREIPQMKDVSWAKVLRHSPFVLGKKKSERQSLTCFHFDVNRLRTTRHASEGRDVITNRLIFQSDPSRLKTRMSLREELSPFLVHGKQLAATAHLDSAEN